MKHITLRNVNEKNEIIQETPLELEEGSILINRIDTKRANQEVVNNIHNYIKKKLENNEPIMTLPEYCHFEILNIKKGD